MTNFTPKDFNHLSTYFLAIEAQKRGYAVEKLFPKTKNSELCITNNVGQKVFIFGQRASTLPYNAHYICKYKNVTKKFLSDANISISKGKTFTKNEIDDALEYFTIVQKPVVLKPIQGTWGSDVYLNIVKREDAQKIIKKFKNRGATFIIEEQSIGDEYRILASCDETLGIIHRIPANIIGDGVHTIKELVNKKNSDPKRSNDHSSALVEIQLDTLAKKLLSSQNLNINSVPKKDEQIFLRDNSNISTGGDSIDYTDIAHPKVKELATRVIQSIPGLPYAGFDFLTPDITKDPLDVGYTVIEINDSPMISMHHAPYKGKPRNVSAKIIDLLF